MSNPFEPPFAQPNPGQGLQSGPLQPPPPPYLQQRSLGQTQWQSSPSTPRQTNWIAITALVVSCVAMVLVCGVILFGAVAGFSSAAGDLQGTAPQVVAGKPYPAQLLADEVDRVISADAGDVTSMSCPEDMLVTADAVMICHGVVDDFDSEVTVTFDDDLGHFTLVED